MMAAAGDEGDVEEVTRVRGGGDVGDEKEMVECGSSGCCCTVAEVADGVDMVVVTATIWPKIWPERVAAPDSGGGRRKPNGRRGREMRAMKVGRRWWVEGGVKWRLLAGYDGRRTAVGGDDGVTMVLKWVAAGLCHDGCDDDGLRGG
ncbi:hypothetical protein Tco_0617021 [Tanacetum coccineum]